MRVLIVSNLYPPYAKGGHEIQCQFAAEILAERGHEVFVLTSRYGIDMSTPLREARIFRRFLYYTEIRSLFRRVYAGVLNRANYFIARQVIKKIKPEVAYIGQLNGVSVYPLKALKQARVPLVFHIGHYYFCELARHCVHEASFLRRRVNQALTGFHSLREFDFSHMIAVSTAIKTAHVKAGYSEAAMAVIPPLGLSEQRMVQQARSAPDFARQGIRLLFVGRLTQTKGIHIALEALQQLRYAKALPKFTFQIIGEGDAEYTAQLAAMVRTGGLQEHVHFEGFVAFDEIIKAYDSADLLLVPSLEEPFGLIVIEAMARGLPVLASAVGGIVDIITPGQNSLLFEAGKSRELADQIVKLMNTPETYVHLSQNALATVKATYTRAAVAGKLVEYIQNVGGVKP